MSATISSLPLKAVLVGTELLEISDSGVSKYTTSLGFSNLYQLLSLKDAANGYAGLDASSLLNVSQIPTAIPAINIADGTVDNTEFQFLNGVTSSIQTQLGTKEDSANKGAVSGYAGLDASQELLLANFPSGTGLQVLRRNSGNTALEFATLSDLQGVTSINADTTAAQVIAGTASRITVGTAAGTTTINIDTSYIGQSTITTLGTITTGVWNGTAITGANINAASTDLTDTAVIVRTNQTNVFGDFLQTFKDNQLKINSPDDADGVTFVNSNQTTNRNLTIPILTANRTIVVTGEASQITIGTEVTGASTALTDTTSIAYLNTANTYIAGNKQSFVADATTAGLNINAQIPSGLAVGDIYRSAEVLHFIGTTATDYILVSDGQPTTYTAGVRQNFLGLLAGTAGINVGGIAGNPTTQVDGDVWLNTSSNTLFGRINGANVDLGAGAAGGDMVLADVQTVTGAKTFGTIGGAVGKFILAGSTSGSTILNAAAIAGSTTITLPGTTGTVVITGLASQITIGTEVTGAITDLSDVTAKTGTGTIAVFDTSPTIVTPTIASFTNAAHDHSNAAGGGQLLSTAALSDTANIAYLNTANTWTTGLQNFAAVTLRIPVSATPSVTVDGDIAYDTTVTDFSTGLIKFFGTEEQAIVTMPIAQFTTPSDGFVVTYNVANNEFELTAAGVGDMILASIQTVTGAKTFGTIGGAVDKFILAGSTSGSTIVNAAAIAGTTTITLQGITGTVALLGDKLDAFAATTSAELATVISDETGSGLLVFGTSPTLVTPALGVPSALTLTNATGLPPAGVTGVAAVQTDNLSVFAATTSAQLAGVISDETGSGLLVFGTSPTLTTPRFADLGFIADANGNEMLIFDTVASAVNNLQLANAATANDIIISAVGETNVGININPAGTGLVTVDNFVGTGTKRIEYDIVSASFSATYDLDLTGNDQETISLTGNITFTTSNRSSGRSKTIRILTDGTLRTLTFPAWDFVGTKPTDQAATKTGILTLTAYGTADTDIVAAYDVEA